MLVKEPSAISFYKHFLLPAFHSAPIVNGEVTPGHLIIFKFPATSQTHCNLDNPVWHRRNVPHTMETNTNHVQFPQLVLGRFPAPSPAHSPLEDGAGSPLPAQPQLPASCPRSALDVWDPARTTVTAHSSQQRFLPWTTHPPAAQSSPAGAWLGGRTRAVQCWRMESHTLVRQGWNPSPVPVQTPEQAQPHHVPTACPKATGQG